MSTFFPTQGKWKEMQSIIFLLITHTEYRLFNISTLLKGLSGIPRGPFFKFQLQFNREVIMTTVKFTKRFLLETSISHGTHIFYSHNKEVFNCIDVSIDVSRVST